MAMVNRLSIVRNFAYLFISSEEKTKGYGIVTRMTIPLLLLFSLSITYIVPGKAPLGLHILFILIYELLLIWKFTKIKTFISSLTLVLIIIAIGFIINILSHYIGNPIDIDPISLIVYSARMAGIVIALSMVFQLISLRELIYIVEMLRLSKLSSIIAIVFSQIPLTAIQFSEAIITARLKYGRKYLFLAIKPLIIESILNSRSIAESLYLYGLPKIQKPMLFNPRRDLPLLILSLLVSVIPMTIPLQLYIQPLG